MRFAWKSITKIKLSDNNAKTIIKKIINYDNVSEFQALETEKMVKFIKKE